MRLTHKPAPPGVLVVSGETVTCDDITAVSSEMDATMSSLRERLMALARQTTLEEFMEVARPQVRQRLNANISNVILYKRALRQLGDDADEQLDKIVEKDLRRFVFEHGNDGAAADAALREMGMSRERFKEYRKKQILTDYYVRSKLPYDRPITHREMLECYDRIKDEHFRQAGLVQFRLIDIDAAKVSLSEKDDDPLQAARSLANSLMERIRAGEDFAALAREYSHGFRREAGGLWPARDPDALAQPYDVLAEKARDMTPGDVAGPVEVSGHVFIVKLEQKQEKGYRPYAEVQDRVEEQIRAERRLGALKELDAEVARQVALADTSAFVDVCLESLYRQARARQPAQ